MNDNWEKLIAEQLIENASMIQKIELWTFLNKNSNKKNEMQENNLPNRVRGKSENPGQRKYKDECRTE